MQTIFQTIKQVKEIETIKRFVTKERFIHFAEVEFPKLHTKEIEYLWDAWDKLSTLSAYTLREVPEELIIQALDIARKAFDCINNGATIIWHEKEPETPRWKVYYRTDKDGELKTTCINLLRKEDAIKYASMLKQEDIVIERRVDYYESVSISPDKGKIDIYDGDIIFCTDRDQYSWNDKSGAYICIDDCYKRLMYTPGRGYICRGTPDYQQDKHGNDCRYNSHVFNDYHSTFQVVGNIYIDNSVLTESKEKQQ